MGTRMSLETRRELLEQLKERYRWANLSVNDYFGCVRGGRSCWSLPSPSEYDPPSAISLGTPNRWDYPNTTQVQ